MCNFVSRFTAPWGLAAVASTLVLAFSLHAEQAKPGDSPGGAEPAAQKAAQAAPAASPADTGLRTSADEFVRAFNQGDAQAVAALWTPDGSLADDHGRFFKGRKAIEDEYSAFFKEHPGAKIEIAVQSIDRPAQGTAIEDGMARVVIKDGMPPSASRYTAVHVLVDGKWLMATVRETGVELPSSYRHLQDLEWLIGNWQTKAEGVAVQASFRWIANKSFVEREYSVRHDGLLTSSGTQIIGWDPQSGSIRSWSFDSSGGHGTALWTADPDGWRIETRGVLADGTPTSSRELLIRVAGEDKVLGWRSFDRHAGQISLPNTPEVVLERVDEKP